MSDVAPPDTRGLPADFEDRVQANALWREDAKIYGAYLAEANERMNLVGPSTLGQFWTRHVVDSAQLLWFAPDALTWADLGSGAGLPGLILAILLKGRRGAHVHLVESMTKRCAFLTEMVGRLDLPATVHNTRAESLELSVDMVTARACAPLDRLLGYAAPFMGLGARALFLKGAEIESELVEAKRRWRFRSWAEVSLSDARGRLVWIEELSLAGRR